MALRWSRDTGLDLLTAATSASLKALAPIPVKQDLPLDVISECLQKELSLGRMLGPYSNNHRCHHCMLTDLGSFRKGIIQTSGGWSPTCPFPQATVSTMGSTQHFAQCPYTTVDDVAALVAILGKGALLAKVDIESAYCLIPVHPQDRPYTRWSGRSAVHWSHVTIQAAFCTKNFQCCSGCTALAPLPCWDSVHSALSRWLHHHCPTQLRTML